MDIVNHGYEILDGLGRIYKDCERRHVHSIKTSAGEGRQGALDWMLERGAGLKDHIIYHRHHPFHPTGPQWVKNRGFRVPVSHQQEEDEG